MQASCVYTDNIICYTHTVASHLCISYAEHVTLPFGMTDYPHNQFGVDRPYTKSNNTNR